jgi:hypothetical protein
MARHELRGGRRVQSVTQVCRKYDRRTLTDKVRLETESDNLACRNIGKRLAVIWVSEQHDSLHMPSNTRRKLPDA